MPVPPPVTSAALPASGKLDLVSPNAATSVLSLSLTLSLTLSNSLSLSLRARVRI